MSAHRVVIGLWAAAYVIVVAAANVLTSTFGLVPAGFGLAVTAGTYTAGFALVLRDTLHDLAGARVVLVALAAGAVWSAVTADPRIAVASSAAAIVAELVDFAVYVPVRRRSRTAAIAVSGLAGGVVDTVGFLALAGFPLTVETVGGQLFGQGRLGEWRVPACGRGGAPCGFSETPARPPSAPRSETVRSA